MPALPTVVTDYLTAVKSSLSQGSDLGSNVRGAALNYLRAQDMASVLDLLQDGLDTSSALTAVSGTTTSVTDGAATYTADEQAGNVVTFTGNVTAALAGAEARVSSNTTTTLTFDEALAAAPAIGDTYQIRGGIADGAITALREGKGLADSPSGSVYGETRTVSGAMTRFVRQLGGTVTERNIGRPGLQTAAGSTTTEVKLETAGVPYRTDELRGRKMTVTGFEARIVRRNTEDTATVSPAYASAPAGGTAVAITVPEDDTGSREQKLLAHPGAQSGENAMLSELIDQVQTLVEAYTLPT